jgi:uncharacterized membrane protein
MIGRLNDWLPSPARQADTKGPTTNLPDHIEETIRSIAELRAEHHESATVFERALDRVTALLSRPWFIGTVSIVVIGWIGLNLGAVAFGARPIDPPPFSGLGGAVSLVSLFMVVLILATQRREDQLAQRREMLLLELALLGEQKTAKVIQLLEESRLDNPLIRNRLDPEAEAMAQPTDPKSVLDVIKETHMTTPE